MALSREEKALCSILKSSLKKETIDGKQKEELASVDMDVVLGIAESHRVKPLTYDLLVENHLISEGQRQQIQSSAQVTIRQNYRLLFLIKYILEILKKSQIPALVLKGASVAQYYPTPELRKSGDVDLLLQNREAAEQAAQILQQEGFVVEDVQLANHHIVCTSPDKIEVELHFMVVEPFDDKEVNEYLNGLIPEFFQTAIMCNIMGVEMLLPGKAYQAFYMLLHMLQHFLRAGFGLKFLCDWAAFWYEPMEAEEKDRLLQMLKESGIGGFARLITQICMRYFAVEPDAMAFLTEGDEGKEKDMEEFLADVLEGQEFGRASAERMVVLRGTKPMDYVREFHHQMHLSYPQAGKWILCWPVLWIMTLIGFLRRNRTIRGVSGRAILKKTAQRSRMVEKMELFKRK